MAARVVLAAAVEGIVDEAVLGRIAREIGAELSPVHGKKGKHDIQRRLGGFNQSAKLTPWVVLVDLNSSAACAPTLRNDWLPIPAPLMHFRVAVRQIEAWLMGDVERLAAFLGVSPAILPRAPEAEVNPKETMVNLARRSPLREIRLDMVPREKSGRAIGPAYPSRLIEFAQDSATGWRPTVAAQGCDSLARCLRRLRDVAAPTE